PALRARPGRAGQIVQVVPLRLVEPESLCDGVEHLRGDPGEIPALHPRVVLDAHAGEHRDLLAAQAGHTTAGAADDARLLRSDPIPARAQEVRDRCSMIHAPTLGPVPCWEVDLSYKVYAGPHYSRIILTRV